MQHKSLKCHTSPAFSKAIFPCCRNTLFLLFLQLSEQAQLLIKSQSVTKGRANLINPLSLLAPPSSSTQNFASLETSYSRSCNRCSPAARIFQKSESKQRIVFSKPNKSAVLKKEINIEQSILSDAFVSGRQIELCAGLFVPHPDRILMYHR